MSNVKGATTFSRRIFGRMTLTRTEKVVYLSGPVNNISSDQCHFGDCHSAKCYFHDCHSAKCHFHDCHVAKNDSCKCSVFPAP